MAAAGLGTLNHSALTAEALRARRLTCTGFVVGSWPQPPQEPDLAMRCNLDDLPVVTGAPLLGRLPAGAGALPTTRVRVGRTRLAGARPSKPWPRPGRRTKVEP